MLWLAGLVGMAGVGAAAFVGVKPDTVDEESGVPEDENIHLGSGDLLLDQIREHSTEDGLLQSGTNVDVNAAPIAPTGPGWGDAVLNEVMADIESAAEHQPEMAPFVTGTDLLDTPEAQMDDAAAPLDQLLSDWIAERVGADILDYEADNDSLMVVWDDTDPMTAEPHVDVLSDPEHPDVMYVSMNGETVAEVYGDSGLSVADLTLIPLSSAMAVGLEAA
ncbi:hypothetical protein [Roseobacter sinensis]|uniref:Uncharacterized protein n=1 Tax=Roseobacter sinensis TaxID=2931391 RepID=A0ABT3B9J2_9RHOB|nr:hypothetical protein [Roseobacter sp. WL0113]MCV3270246.1 hypothetical protein [Roseobacter sp. WL0113]